MRKERYYELRDKLLKDAVDTSTAKGADYTQKSDDALKNFKGVAEDMGLTPMQTLGVYMKKHQDAISSYIKHGGQLESEPIRERIIDNINYLCLLYGLIVEQEGDVVLKNIDQKREDFHRQAFKNSQSGEAFHVTQDEEFDVEEDLYQTAIRDRKAEQKVKEALASETAQESDERIEEARSGFMQTREYNTPYGQIKFSFLK